MLQARHIGRCKAQEHQLQIAMKLPSHCRICWDMSGHVRTWGTCWTTRTTRTTGFHGISTSRVAVSHSQGSRGNRRWKLGFLYAAWSVLLLDAGVESQNKKWYWGKWGPQRLVTGEYMWTYSRGCLARLELLIGCRSLWTLTCQFEHCRLLWRCKVW